MAEAGVDTTGLVCLEEVLQFREKKAQLQLQMLRAGENAFAVSLGMNIPGPVKCSPLIHRAFLEGMEKLEKLIQIQKGKLLRKEQLEERAGYAAVYLVSGIEPDRLKEEAVLLEEIHALGRIWDIDVFEGDGRAIGREMAGIKRRKCLLCDGDAKECGRSRKHSISELQNKVDEIILNWQAENMA